MDHVQELRQLGRPSSHLSFLRNTSLILLLLMLTASRGLSQPFHQDASDIYNLGPLEVDVFSVASNTGLFASQGRYLEGRKLGVNIGEVELGANRPPLPLLVASPTKADKYPLIQFQHGFLLENSEYSQLLKHVASHGFIVVAPQMYSYYVTSDATEEICHAANVLAWMSTGLADVISQRVGASVMPDLSKVALAGHSRGGKVAFGLAERACKSSVNYTYSAVVGIDPVDGSSDTAASQSEPHILQFSAHDLDLTVPTLVVGTGLGSKPRAWLIPACAPQRYSHAEFFFESKAPAYHFVASGYGHMDMLDDVLSWLGDIESAFCTSNGSSKDPMRRFTAGIVVAFLNDALLGDDSQLSDAIKNVASAPVTVDPLEVYS